ncbi:N,N-dimethylformamidase beta subunit family domain-containing protein [uncultured Roseovarius sp.]|uniref:N,N-dimethylformamidase beta subunit family domain-containing protein n=1 Tax=uncultured Roseovarius sp. TaxID=293344 RepID=UPI00260598EA|nr:N,N-dimethylformamidase beta subunit family domain-containing protein [uncultured Roseovarius sp.]
MNEHTKELPLLGYVDRLSASPGETIEFKVSSLSEQPFTAQLMRSISADPNPESPGIVEKDATAYFPRQEFPSVRRPFTAGSYGIGQKEISAPQDASLTFVAKIYPTLLTGQPQTILGAGDYQLFIDANGSICLRIGFTVLSTDSKIKLRHWHQIEAHVEGTKITLRQQQFGRYAEHPITIEGFTPVPPQLAGIPTVAAALKNNTVTQHFNGKIEAPVITANGAEICAWDFSCDIPKQTIPAIAGPDLNLINFPTRATTSHAWDGSEMNWSHRPAHYAAIHFHEDDIYDFGWDTDFSFTLPDNMPSGVYIMRLCCGTHSDAIPFFVCASKENGPQADLCVLISTFTYSIYGNHARPDYHPSWQDRIDDWDAYPYNPAKYPHYGLSTYNTHSDGYGICHASHHRPLFNLRPGYLTFGDATCSGLRHFPADMHLISWLHAKGIEYDVVTDHELHREGHAAIEGYKSVTTGSHPEYHTSVTLNALQDYRDAGGHLMYLGGNGFYWRIAVHSENDSLLEIRRAEDGIRAWAAEPGEYYNAFDGSYGGLWRRNGRAPQELVAIGFAAQGEFFGDPYRRTCTDPAYDWVFEGIEQEILGEFGYSGNGAAGFELDHMDARLGTPENTVLLARSVTREQGFMLVPEEQLTHLTNLTGGSESDAKHADMILAEYPGGGSVFATGSITFCGSLPWNDYDNNISRLLENVMRRNLN